jgi:hypothetical protein
MRPPISSRQLKKFETNSAAKPPFLDGDLLARTDMMSML